MKKEICLGCPLNTEKKQEGLNKGFAQNGLGLRKSPLSEAQNDTALAGIITKMGQKCLLEGDGRIDRDC